MPIVTTEIRGSIAILKLTRPEMLNALGQTGDGIAIQDACAALNDDHAIRCVILTGEGRAFSAGGDLRAMANPEGPFSGDVLQVRDNYRANIHRAARAIYGLDMPVIAAVNGAAIGLGCDVACMADIRIASANAKFGVTFLRIGLVPGDGGSWLLPRVIGMSRAAELLFTGDVIDAETAASWGLVSRVVPADELMDQAMAMASKIAALPPHSLRMTKTLLRRGTDISYDTALDMAAMAQVVAHSTADHLEGVNAMLEKREPVFKGR